ncbi:MAG: AAA family ATPase [Candidatus Tectomicrobia bacterium]|nr:AAA family ATPase [Candidatus Tectomicrobia bacterium]
MFTRLQLNGYRGFESYGINDLARVNLLVGKNNSGKTSVLEAINLLTDSSSLRALARFATQRRQQKYWFFEDQRDQRNVEILDVSPVFFGHRMKPNTQFTVASNRNELSMETVAINRMENDKYYSDPEIQEVARKIGETAFMGLKITGNWLNLVHPVFLVTESGSLIYSNQLRQYTQWETEYRSRFLSTIPMSPFDIRNIWEKVIRERRETYLADALRTLEPDIDLIHLLPGNWSVDNVLVDRKSGGPRIGIGSFGEGMRRLLDLALALIDSANGVLLIDEIDTGLHWTVMEDLWRFVINAARRSNVQVFATTHSYDCLKGLASVLENDVDLASDVSLQKIERALPQAVSLPGEKIPVAIEREIEVR